MYGMVNDGIRRFVTENHGEAVWEEIRRDAGVDISCFDAMTSVDDAVTYNLVGAICKRFGIEAAQALQAFGEYWPSFAGQTSYGALMDFSGGDFVEFLESLDEMHERIAVTMPHLKPPSFEVERLSEDSLNLYYSSERPGLAPMVLGLLNGLAARFNVAITVTHTAGGADGRGADVFFIKFAAERTDAQTAA